MASPLKRPDESPPPYSPNGVLRTLTTYLNSARGSALRQDLLLGLVLPLDEADLQLQRLDVLVDLGLKL